MVDESDPVYATILLLDHLGQLRASYGPAMGQNCSRRADLIRKMDSRVFIFFQIFLGGFYGIDSLRVLDDNFFLIYVIESK